MNTNVDVLVLGAGIAGLSYALKLSESDPDLNIAILAKSSPPNCNTYMAQGGISSVADFTYDSFESHIGDTIKAGAGFCDENIVRMTVTSAPSVIDDLIRWGVNFDFDSHSKPDLHREGGHSANRIWHVKDHTGREIEMKLFERVRTLSNVKIHQNVMAVDLLMDHSGNACEGIRALDVSKHLIVDYYAKITMLAGGGSCAVFKHSTNPESATGDAVAIANRAGVDLRNMDYVQFHPTALLHTGIEGSLPLLTEALRGEGAFIVNHDNERFLFKDDPRGEMATRDIVSKLMLMEMHESGKENMFLDCRHIHDVKRKFPSLSLQLKSLGYDFERDLLPIVPAAHYQCGGITVDGNGCTNVNRLYASGECSNTGLHGKNRLASNSLLEALVFSKNAARHSKEVLATIAVKFDVSERKLQIKSSNQCLDELNSIRVELKRLMSQYCGILKTSEGLLKLNTEIINLESKLSDLYKMTGVSKSSIEMNNMIQVSKLIMQHALIHDENQVILQ